MTTAVPNRFANGVGNIPDADLLMADFDYLCAQLDLKAPLSNPNFLTAVGIAATSNHLSLATASFNLILSAAAQATANRTWTIPDVAGNATFAALGGTQTFTGIKTFNDLRATLGANLAAGGFKLTGLAAGSAAGESARFEQLRILQAPVFGSETTGGSQTPNSFANVGASLTITPISATSTIYIFFSGRASVSSTGTALIGCSGTTNGDLVTPSNTPYCSRTTSAQTVSGFFKDVPATVAAQTYRLRLAGDGIVASNFGGGAATGSSTFILAIEVQ